jgi:ribosomal protein S15P/S13E
MESMIKKLIAYFKKPEPTPRPVLKKVVVAKENVFLANSKVYAGDLFTIEKVRSDGFIYIKALGAFIPESDAFDFSKFIYVSNEFEQILKEVNDEVVSASGNWPPFNSAHEGFAILMEEVEELKEHVFTNQKRRDLAAMRKEAIQVAAMAVRFVNDVTDEENGRK